MRPEQANWDDLWRPPLDGEAATSAANRPPAIGLDRSALASHARGHWFKSSTVHSSKPAEYSGSLFVLATAVRRFGWALVPFFGPLVGGRGR